MQELNHMNCFHGVVIPITLTISAQLAVPLCPRDVQALVCSSAGLWALAMSGSFILLLLIVCFEQLCVALLAHPSLSLHAALLPVIQPPDDRFDFMTTNLLLLYYSQVCFRF